MPGKRRGQKLEKNVFLPYIAIIGMNVDCDLSVSYKKFCAKSIDLALLK